MISSQNHHCCLRISSCNGCTCPTYSGCRTSSHWLSKYLGNWHCRQVFSHQLNHTTTGHNPCLLRRYQTFYSYQGFLYHTPTIRQWQKLFRETRSAEWPQPCSTSTGQNNRVEMFHIYYNSFISMHIRYKSFLASCIH